MLSNALFTSAHFPDADLLGGRSRDPCVRPLIVEVVHVEVMLPQQADSYTSLNTQTITHE